MKKRLLLVGVFIVVFLCISDLQYIKVNNGKSWAQGELDCANFEKSVYNESNVINFDISKVYVEPEFSFVYSTCVCVGCNEENSDIEEYNPVFSIVDINNDTISHFSQKITIKGYKHIHHLDLLSNRKIICTARDENDNDVFAIIENGKFDKVIPLENLPEEIKAYKDSALLFYENYDSSLVSYSAYLLDIQSGEQKKVLDDIGDMVELRVYCDKILYFSVKNNSWIIYENGNQTNLDFDGEFMDFADNETIICYRKHKFSRKFNKITGSFYRYDLETGKIKKMFSCVTDESIPSRFILSNSGKSAIFSVGGKNVFDSYLLSFDNKEMLKLKYEYMHLNEPVYR